jgi:hypothetical protein
MAILRFPLSLVFSRFSNLQTSNFKLLDSDRKLYKQQMTRLEKLSISSN